MFFKMYKRHIEINIVKTGSVIHPTDILPAIDHFTSLPPFNNPIPITPPTIA